MLEFLCKFYAKSVFKILRLTSSYAKSIPKFFFGTVFSLSFYCIWEVVTSFEFCFLIDHYFEFSSTSGFYLGDASNPLRITTWSLMSSLLSTMSGVGATLTILTDRPSMLPSRFDPRLSKFDRFDIAIPSGVTSIFGTSLAIASCSGVRITGSGQIVFGTSA